MDRRPMIRLSSALALSPLVAILRGITPDAVEAVADVLVSEGVRVIEVPLNSPDPFTSIARLARRYADDVLIGAGTVLNVADVQRVRDTGAVAIISPNTNAEVIGASREAGMISLPGYATPSEAFAALAAGASGLKLFPAENASPAVLKAHRAVLPPETVVIVVGGVTPDRMAQWRPWCQGFGLGTALYQPGQSADDVRSSIKRFNQALSAT